MTVPANVKHVAALINNMHEVRRLLDIHTKITTAGPGRKPDVQVLHKSAIVLSVACWEAFVEDLANASLAFVVETCTDPKTLPQKLRDRVASKNSGSNAWNLAGDGWKQAIRDNLTEVLAKTTGAFNTPKTSQVNELFEKALGAQSLSTCWRWHARSVAQACEALDDLVTLRGSIAHRVQATSAVRRKDVIEARELIARLATKSSNHLRVFLHGQTGKYPWDAIRFRKTQ